MGKGELSNDAKGLGVCPVCGATIGGVHLILLEKKWSAQQIHAEHLGGYPVSLAGLNKCSV